MTEAVLARLQHLMALRGEVEALTEPAWQPAADWRDAGTHLELVLDVPGADPESLTMQEDGDLVRVSGERPPLPGRLVGERPSGPFSRALPFPEPVRPGSGAATLSAGVLTVRFEKRRPTLEAPNSGARGRALEE